MKRLERNLRNKNLQLKAEKSKTLCFRKGRGRRRRMKWMWKGKRIEKVSGFKYLGYVIKKIGGGDDRQIRELKKKGNIVIRRIWGLGERLFKDDFRRRMMLFSYMVMEVIM